MTPSEIQTCRRSLDRLVALARLAPAGPLYPEPQRRIDANNLRLALDALAALPQPAEPPAPNPEPQPDA